MYNTKDENLLRLFQKIKENPQSFIFIVGAGLSKVAGMPSWKELAEGMIDYYEQWSKDIGENEDEKVKNLRKRDNYWEVFSELQDVLPQNQYRKYISEKLSDHGRSIPLNYKMIWKMDVCGVITFNIDKLILNAYSSVFRKSVDFATKDEWAKYNYFPVSTDKFVLFPHGQISDASSWVFTEKEKKSAYKNSNLCQILSTLINSKNLVILGFNPKEYSFLSLLNNISIGEKISGYDNYYIGTGIDAVDIKKLDEYGISCITYYPEDEKHSDIEKILKDMYAYIPKDIEYPSVYYGKKYSPQDIPKFQDCLGVGLDKLREILNGNIAQIIPVDIIPTKDQINRLQEFYHKYSAQLHTAWFIDPQSVEGQELHGYTLKQSVGRGAFGNVYEAYSKEGVKYAIKILLPEVKDKVEYLSCFRRGIRSMKMLKEHNIDGMVKIHSSYEVPACIVMDYIEGNTLRDAIDKKLLGSFHKKLEVLEKVADIIHKSHNLRECILHRDLKPENIMLEDFYYEDELSPLKVTILDFDLSWHKGATELTVALGAMSQGFMAPEQAEEKDSFTRNTAVDVYSIGMISYYVLTGENPAPYQHRFSYFKEELLEIIRNNYKINWTCLPQFLTETIVNATLHDINKRLSLDAYLSNIKLAHNLLLSDEIPNTHPLVLRELACQIADGNIFTISDFGRNIVIETNSLGKRICLALKQNNKEVVIHVEMKKLRRGDENRVNTAKYLENAKNKALSNVNRTVFYHSEGDVGISEVTINLQAKLPPMVRYELLKNMSKNIKEVREKLELK